MPKVIMFDLYDTLLKGVSFNFKKGVEYLHETYFKDKCSLEEIIAFSDTFLPLYLARKEKNTELCFVTDELPQYFSEYDVPLPEDLDEALSRPSDTKTKDSIKAAIKFLDSIGKKHTICEIGKERIRRAGKIVKEEAGVGGQSLDLGFRVLKLDSSNMADVYYTPQESGQKTLLDENVKPDRCNEDLLFQVMLDLGIELSAKIEAKQIAGKTVHFVDGNYLVACFDSEVNETTITEIAKLQPVYFVMSDSSAANDNVIDNFEQIFRHFSPYTNCRIL